MKQALAALLSLLAFAIVGPACTIDQAPDGLKRTPGGDGPEVVFDTSHRPLPEIPLPNDVASFADPTSRTGRRINVSLVAPTRLETDARVGFNTLEGWGTFAPITVSFARERGGDAAQPAIDLEEVAARTRDYDPADDPFYVIDLSTGLPVILDMGKGNFPLALVDRNRYWANDPRATEDSLMFETVEEGAGLPQAAYRPSLDTDFDGVLDHPNVLRPNGRNARIEDVIPWYERESDTLILRPVVPLDEKHEYAVVLTDRLRATSGRAVRSPFEFVHHAQQRRGAERVRDILADASRRAYYGDLAGTGLEHVAFTWTFTTQPVYDDMRLLRDGLHGRGPFAHLATTFPPVGVAARAVGTVRDPAEEQPGAIDANINCATKKNTPYIVKSANAKDTFRQLLGQALGLSGPELERLMESLDDVDHFVVGSFQAPYFMGDPEHEDQDGRFELDYKNGTGRINKDTVQFWISVPKARGAMKQPFPTTVWAHGTSLHADEIIIRSGYFAKQGIAMMGVNMPGHGLYLGNLENVAQAFLSQACFAPWTTALVTGRHRDLNGDGEPDSGGLLWTAHLFHSRDNIRQSVIDELQATRVLRAFDGVRRVKQDYNRDGIEDDLAGDFDGDGVPDLGGPNVPITTAGNSFGGVLAMVHGALDPNVVAAAAISGGGGLTDVATRSALVPDSVLQQVLSPLVVGVPAKAVETKNGVAQTRCTGDQRSVRFVVNDLTNSREVEIACLPPNELGPGKTVILENLRNGERKCARTGTDGRFRIPIPADVLDRLDLQIYDAPDAVVSYKGCEVLPGAPVGRRVRTFEQAAVSFTPVANTAKTCEAAIAASAVDAPSGCAQFRDFFFPVGSPLVSPQEGLGLTRQSPEARRLFALVQAALDSGDPINFAPYYGLRDAPGLDGAPMPPRAIIEWNTTGDPLVPAGTGWAFGRAAGAVPFLPPTFATSHPAWADYATPQALFDALGGKTPNEVLIATSSLESLARFERSRSGPACKANYVSSPTCTAPPSTADCARALWDVDWLAEGANQFDAPHPPVPLRLARAADVRAADPAAVARAWAPRIVGSPFTPDPPNAPAPPLVGVLGAYIQMGGQHVFVNGDPCKAFDDTRYNVNLLARFLATRGTDLYALSHPSTHRCLEKETCGFFAP